MRFEKKLLANIRIYLECRNRQSDSFYQNYDLYVKREQSILGMLLVAKAKSEVDYINPKWYRNIVFDEDALNKLTELFPERQIKTDYDAAKLIQELGDKALTELQSRLKEKKEKKH